MKKYLTGLLLLLPILFTGCLKWDNSDCGQGDNCILRFQLTGAGGGDILSENISVIDIALFNNNNTLVEHHKITQNELDENHCFPLSVEPGEYRIVCWGNVINNTVLSSMEPETTTFENSDLEVLSTESMSAVYYGPSQQEKVRSTSTRNRIDYTEYSITVPAKSVVEKPVNLVRSHRTIHIYLKDWGNHDQFDGIQPIVEIQKLPYKYDFYQNTTSDRRDYYRQAEETTAPNGNILSKASFSFPISDFEEDMVIALRRKTDNFELFSLNLKSWVEENTPEYVNEFDILFSVDKDANISVTIPNWDAIEVSPGK